jgi:hypothetical protein
LEFEPFDFGSRSIYVGFDFLRGGVVGFLGSQVDEFGSVAQTACQTVQSDDYLFEFGALLAEFLGAFGVVPNSRLFQFPGYFLKALVLVVVIKDTSSRNRCDPRDL